MRKLIDAQKHYHAICEASWKRYENDEITYTQHEATAETAFKVYSKVLESVNITTKGKNR